MLDFKEQLMAIKTEITKDEVSKMDNKLIKTKVEIKDIDIDKQIKQVKIEVNTNDKIHNNNNKDVVMNKINYNKYNQEAKQEYIDLKDIKRGDIIWINLFGSVGSEQGSDEYGRPCVCIQNDVGNAYSPTIIVSAITSQIGKAKLPTHTLIPSSEKYGLTKDSVVLLEQIRTVDKRKRILRRTGHLDELVMMKIDKALAISIGDLKEKTPLEKLPIYKQDEINKIIKKIYGYDEVIETSQLKDLLIHLKKERRILLNILERKCSENGLNYENYYMPINTKSMSLSM